MNYHTKQITFRLRHSVFKACSESIGNLPRRASSSLTDSMTQLYCILTLTPKQTTDAQLATIVQWLNQHGYELTATPENHVISTKTTEQRPHIHPWGARFGDVMTADIHWPVSWFIQLEGLHICLDDIPAILLTRAWIAADNKKPDKVPCAACDRGDYQLGHADGCPKL